jgi:hypothetical protein
MQRYLNLELSQVFTTVVEFTINKIIKIGLYLKYNWNIIKIQLCTV